MATRVCKFIRAGSNVRIYLETVVGGTGKWENSGSLFFIEMKAVQNAMCKRGHD
jgi:hypothetical protein